MQTYMKHGQLIQCFLYYSKCVYIRIHPLFWMYFLATIAFLNTFSLDCKALGYPVPLRTRRGYPSVPVLNGFRPNSFTAVEVISPLH